jgi:hypothetical protein
VNAELIKAGHTYRSRFGALDYFVVWVVKPNVGYRVETGDLSGHTGMAPIVEFAPRLLCRVPNHRHDEIPTPFRSFGPEES